ncbi:methyltransferase domain-containing protein [Tumidithrix elongata RA019]|uniref:Methyltransferase domain-containing protein n=1 Tax=Tumidithrix elongata BACA0141 TaxID=2716417 RepID=A0AAW9Q3B4_9CYAN|nr:methyltransferase domain-containing protein [Tumidithrix elongata RA019]
MLDLDSILRCPVTNSAMTQEGKFYVSAEGIRYPIVQGVPVLLAPRTESTLWVADASLRAAKEDPENEYHEDTIGITPQELVGLKERLEKHSESSEPVDPIVSFLIGATSGYMYTEQIGKLKTLPIPNIRIPEGNGQVLLDIGCNWGRWSIAAARAGYKVIGIDPSLGAVLAAKRLARDMGLDAEFIVADALQLPFASNTFDVVFSYSVLQHFSPENAIIAIQQAASVSKPNAKLLVQMPNCFGIRCLYHQFRRFFREPHRFEVRYYSPWMLKQMFSSNYGTSYLTVDGFFGLGIQASDRPMLPRSKQLIIDASEFLRRMSKLIPPLTFCADSVYVHAQNTKDLTGKDALRLTV